MDILHRLNLRRFGTGFALFALALQFVVSFGHIHREDFNGFAQSAAVQDARLAASDVLDDDAVQLPKSHPGAAHDHCAVCAAIHLDGAPGAQGPSLALVLQSGVGLLPADQGFRVSSVPFLLQPTRAPPVA